MKSKIFKMAFIPLLALFVAGCGQQQDTQQADANAVTQMTAEQAKQIAKEAYTFGFPFVANYRVFIDRLLTKDPLMMGADFNEFAHMKSLIPADTPDTAQQDTVYSVGVIDLRREPVVISVPQVPDGQAYMLQMGDTSTETLPYISSVTTNNEAGNYVLVGPDYQGLIEAEHFDGVITTRGQLIMMLGRTIVFDPDDLAPVFAIQDGLVMQPLSEFLGKEAPAKPEAIDFIPWDEKAASGLGVFSYINMSLDWHPAATYENDLMARFSKIGVVPGQPFSADGLSPEIVTAMKAGIAEADQEMEKIAQDLTEDFNGWNWTGAEDLSRFGTDYTLRAAIALRNIYPNDPAHAAYGQTFRDASGEQLVGTTGYTVTFAKGELPPVNWFWSLTVYDANTGAMYPNPLERVNVSDRTKGLHYADDGSLTVYVQHDEPSTLEQSANWLPAPADNIYLVLRLYAPNDAAINGEWQIPPVLKQ
ncbi:DUF1254 domain-containing protein [Motilimonas pumila]|uniref:DUF1254 domain-containing protein n=1 Tax=Motilimonas pumila TaxID=2303987 RepID=A0A418YDU2_9GAMM|nr:DUF1214 domain-containing protein [Motilimonas pumila]RJG42674.1 DUF1254 domain-containing protein [Motilimonas pumila]